MREDGATGDDEAHRFRRVEGPVIARQLVACCLLDNRGKSGRRPRHGLIAAERHEMLDAARMFNAGSPPATIRSADGAIQVANIWRDRPAQTILGAEQKAWFLQRLKELLESPMLVLL